MTIKEAREIAAAPENYAADRLRLAQLKLFGKALRLLGGSPAQQAVDQQLSRIHARLRALGEINDGRP
jgi:hypothetical protein